MIRIEGVLRRVIDDLGALRAPWALVGGLAVSTRTEPRFTRDVDVAVAVAGDREAEALVSALVGRGYIPRVALEQGATDRLAAVRLQPPGETERAIVVDLMFASSGIEPELVAAAEPLAVFAGVVAPVARTAHLVALKVLARDDEKRPMDVADLRALLQVSSPEEIEAARVSLRLITERGFQRKKDLLAELETLLSRSGGSKPLP